jgi:nicotinamidase-related amidase
MNEIAANRNPIDPSRREWLLVIDMQRVFAEPASPWVVSQFDEVLAPIETLIAAYAGRVIATRYISPQPPVGAWEGYFEKFASLLLPAEDKVWDLMLAEHLSYRIETRATFGKWDSRVAALLGSDAPIAVCGVATECCVLATVLAAIDDGRSVRVVADACAGSTRLIHEQTLSLMSTFEPLVQITRSDEILRSLKQA